MKINYYFILLALSFITFQNCSSTKVLDAWKAEPSIIETFKTKNVLVIARTSNDLARYAFEKEIADALRARGINASESYHKAPNMNKNKDMSEEHLSLVKSMIKSEGYNAVVITAIKDKKQTKRTTSDAMYGGMPYSTYYPSYYGGFSNYYSYPYAYGSYYSSFGGYNSTTTTVDTTYVLETVIYNMEESDENQLVAVVTSSLDNPDDADKTAKDYVDIMIKTLEDKKK